MHIFILLIVPLLVRGSPVDSQSPPGEDRFGGIRESPRPPAPGDPTDDFLGSPRDSRPAPGGGTGPGGAGAAAAAAGAQGGNPNDEFECVCRPIPGNVNNEFDCKCKSAAQQPGGHKPTPQSSDVAGTPSGNDLGATFGSTPFMGIPEGTPPSENATAAPEVPGAGGENATATLPVTGGPDVSSATHFMGIPEGTPPSGNATGVPEVPGAGGENATAALPVTGGPDVSSATHFGGIPEGTPPSENATAAPEVPGAGSENATAALPVTGGPEVSSATHFMGIPEGTPPSGNATGVPEVPGAGGENATAGPEIPGGSAIPGAGGENATAASETPGGTAAPETGAANATANLEGVEIVTAETSAPNATQGFLGTLGPNGPAGNSTDLVIVQGGPGLGNESISHSGPSENSDGKLDEDTNVVADDPNFGDTYTYVICIKPTSGGGKPKWDWSKENGKYDEIRGKWLKYQCTGVIVDPFLVTAASYKRVNDKCVASGYELAQPANYLVSSWYPFQVQETLQPHYRVTRGFFSNSYDKIELTASDKC